MRDTPTERRLRLLTRATVVALAIACAFAERPLAAQSPARAANGPKELKTQYLADLDHAHTKFLALANAFPAGKYSWTPQSGVRSVGAVFLHVASEYYLYAPMAYGAKPSSVVANTDDALTKFEANPTKEAVIKHLNDSYAYAKATLAAVDPAAVGSVDWFGQQATITQTTIGMTDDLHEHLGQLIAYARMNGITPPWSK